ncbi:MAG: hypothetical protein MUC84_11950 [Solirubrobacteraceae bacterium]|jgi:hypothetical protein|nr:hypothetical protein [Solirubrobacteraceae bacterium]
MASTVRSFPAVLRLRARDLHSGDVEVIELRVDAPADEPGQRTQIEREVQRAFPGARFKTFAGSVASYLTGDQLVVTSYEALGPARPVEPAVAPPEQPTLFAA